MTVGALWQKLRDRLLPTRRPSVDATAPLAGGPSERMAGSLRGLLDDPSITPALRRELAEDFSRVEQMLQRLERGQLHVAVFGRVSTGKSALGNALLGREAFAVGVLHGTTTQADHAALDEAQHDGLVLIDTPGINELDGEARERLAFEVAEVSDLVVFVVDGDLTRDELDALTMLARTQRPLLLVLNKADRYSHEECASLLEQLRQRSAGLLRSEDVLAVAARPVRMLNLDTPTGEPERAAPPQVAALRQRLLQIAEREGKTLTALNAGLHAGRLTDQVGQRLAEARREAAARVIRHYCIAKGVAVALNPMPVADLLAAAGLDAAMVVQLSKVYGLPLTRSESGRLVATISAQL
ncbi:MAG: DUF697 domain-containing protein, partial [Dyella sp.]